MQERQLSFQRAVSSYFSVSVRSKMLGKMGLENGWIKKDLVCQAKELTFLSGKSCAKV